MPKKKNSLLRDRVEAYIKQKGMSIRSFEISLDMPNGTVAQFSDNTSRETLSKIVKKYSDFDIDYIITGRKNEDKNIYVQSGEVVPSEFVLRLFEERKTHDKHISTMLEEQKKSGERIDTLIGMLKDQMNILHTKI